MRLTAAARPATLDVALAMVLTVASQVEIWAPQLLPGVDDVAASRPLLGITTLVMTAPLVLRRAYPLATVATTLTAAVLQSLLTTPTEGLATLAALLVGAYSVSAYAGWRGAAGGAVLLMAVASVIGDNSGDHAFLAIILGGAWLVGFVVAQRSGEVARLTDDNRDLTERLSSASALLAEAEQRAAQGTIASPEGLVELTARELEVVRAIATGRSNGEIAQLLVISEWTVKTHVASILRKLSLRDRAQVVVAAYDSGLVVPGGNATS